LYTIISPPGKHGVLGRQIEAALRQDRAKRNLNTNVKQYTSKGTSKGKKSKVNECKSELFDKITLAVELKLLPTNIQEVEFTVSSTGQALTLEYWPTASRNDSERVEVKIPLEYLELFFFKYALACFTSNNV
jgi:hypothetical protein